MVNWPSTFISFSAAISITTIISTFYLSPASAWRVRGKTTGAVQRSSSCLPHSRAPTTAACRNARMPSSSLWTTPGVKENRKCMYILGRMCVCLCVCVFVCVCVCLISLNVWACVFAGIGLRFDVWYAPPTTHRQRTHPKDPNYAAKSPITVHKFDMRDLSQSHKQAIALDVVLSPFVCF